MCQAVVNLVDNAIKYSNPGGEVLLGLAVRDSRLVISVSIGRIRRGVASLAGQVWGLRSSSTSPGFTTEMSGWIVF
jgi:hypothetical protein